MHFFQNDMPLERISRLEGAITGAFVTAPFFPFLPTSPAAGSLGAKVSFPLGGAWKRGVQDTSEGFRKFFFGKPNQIKSNKGKPVGCVSTNKKHGLII